MNNTLILRNERPLKLQGLSAWFLEIAFIATTILLPIAAHMLGWPVFIALPMFWGVMLSGVVFGWKAGLLVGALSPGLNFLLTGMPIAPLVPIMTVELAIYGALPSLLRDRLFRGNLYLGMAGAMVAGRLFLLGGFMAFLGGPQGVPGWFSGQFLPGIPVQLLQIVLVPVIGAAIIRARRER